MEDEIATKKAVEMSKFEVAQCGPDADSSGGTRARAIFVRGGGRVAKRAKTARNAPANVPAVELLDLPDVVLGQILQQLARYRKPKAFCAAAQACRRLYQVAMGRDVLGMAAVRVENVGTLDIISAGAALRVAGVMPRHLAALVPYGMVNLRTLEIDGADLCGNQISRCIVALPNLRVLNIRTTELAHITCVFDALDCMPRAALEELTVRSEREVHSLGVHHENVLCQQACSRLFFGGWLPNLRKLDVPYMGLCAMISLYADASAQKVSFMCPELTSACVNIADVPMVLGACRGLRKLTVMNNSDAIKDSVFDAISRAKRLMVLRLYGWRIRPATLCVIWAFVESRGEECVIGSGSAFERKYGTELCGGTLNLHKCKFPDNAAIAADYEAVRVAAAGCFRPIRLVLRMCKAIRNETAIKVMSALGPCVGSLQLIDTRLWTTTDASSDEKVGAVLEGSKAVPSMPRVSALTARYVRGMGIKYALRGSVWLPWKTSLRCITIDVSHSGQRLDVGIPNGPIAVTNVAVMHSHTTAGEGIRSVELVRLLQMINTLCAMTLVNCGILTPSVIRRVSALIAAAPASVPDTAFVIRNTTKMHVGEVEDMFWTIKSLIMAHGSARVPRMFSS